MENLILAQSEELYLVNLPNTMYFMADDHYTHVLYSHGQKFLIPFSLATVERQIKESFSVDCPFVRLGRKYIVNMDRVFHVCPAKQELTLIDKTGQFVVIHISKAVLKALHQRIVSNETNFDVEIDID